jgi:hypothetical protein
VEAFGPDGLGIVAVRHVPDFAVKRLALLPLAAQLPTLPDIDSCVDASSLYSIGWSHGKEALGPSGRRDVSKGSYYVNPFASPPDDDDANDDTATSIKNVWPASLPQLRPAVLAMADLLQHVGCLVAKICDAYCQSKQKTVGTSTSSSSSIEQAIRTSRAAKARLLHYFAAVPTVRDNNGGAATTTMNDDDYSWCTWHNDHVRREALTYSVAYEYSFSPSLSITGLSDRSRAWNVHSRRTRD